jgi:hypothetical protein
MKSILTSVAMVLGTTAIGTSAKEVDIDHWIDNCFALVQNPQQRAPQARIALGSWWASNSGWP